jgi:2-polyprenyl-6-methoxyphenol hydroxylase-like FAD-dependent oxidoreductase
MQMDLNDRNSGLQVLVVGGSIGGLSTAIALKAQGHCVKVS